MTKEMEKRDAPVALTAGSKAPAALSNIIHLEAWAQSVAFGHPYKEPDPDFISRMLAIETIMGNSVEEVMRQDRVDGLQEWLPDKASETTGPQEITDLYVASSDFELGAKTFVIMTCTDLMSGDTRKVTTGALNVQATLIGLLKLGHYPIRCQFKRGISKDKGGKFLIHMLPPD